MGCRVEIQIEVMSSFDASISYLFLQIKHTFITHPISRTAFWECIISAAVVSLKKTHGVPGGGRLIGRDGSCHLRWAPRGPRAALRRLGDVWTSLLELRWGLMLLTFGATFALSWLLFGLAWYALALLHGDLGPGREASAGPVCVQKLTGLLTAFLFALESQLTIGYGAMYPDPEACPAAAALLSAHMVLGLMLDALMTGAFVAKIARPKLRAGTIRFSGAAVVWWGRGDQRRPRRRLLAFRVANLRPSALLDVAVSAVLYRSRPGRPLRQSAVDFQLDRLGARPCPYFLFPLTFHHELGPDSPLLPLLRERRWPDEHVELAVFLQATCEGSGTVCRQRTSYLRSEVLVDRLFAPIGVDVERGVMDLSLFDVTVAEEESGVSPLTNLPLYVSVGHTSGGSRWVGRVASQRPLVFLHLFVKLHLHCATPVGTGRFWSFQAARAGPVEPLGGSTCSIAADGEGTLGNIWYGSSELAKTWALTRERRLSGGRGRQGPAERRVGVSAHAGALGYTASLRVPAPCHAVESPIPLATATCPIPPPVRPSPIPNGTFMKNTAAAAAANQI
ncbi:unnamed protein product [Lampetra planeri]